MVAAGGSADMGVDMGGAPGGWTGGWRFGFSGILVEVSRGTELGAFEEGGWKRCCLQLTTI